MKKSIIALLVAIVAIASLFVLASCETKSSIRVLNKTTIEYDTIEYFEGQTYADIATAVGATVSGGLLENNAFPGYMLRRGDEQQAVNATDLISGCNHDWVLYN